MAPIIAESTTQENSRTHDIMMRTSSEGFPHSAQYFAH